ncbi:cytochrome P450 [Rhodococcus qingshengii]|uniref:cytochrome P450 n=1 Tax=Rhodococcus qingshengii TaxID=334542 RepID=UPI0024BA3229|nr:cytochrome P450 [Rhodococcus qingshengii]MDJ0441098.1 cytochrome P450 [Rhodococcus qingshengii]
MTTTDQTGFFNNAPMMFDRTKGWEYIRERGEVYEADGKWYLTSAEAVRFAQRHPEIFSSARAFDSISTLITLIPLAVDPPQHSQYRRVLDPMLSPKVINTLEDSLRQQVRELIDAFADSGSCDIVTDLANIFPTQAILTLFGLPLEDRDKLMEWSEVLISGALDATPGPEQMAAAVGLFGYLQEQIAIKRENLSDDMLSSILALTGEDAWTEPELLGLCFLFILAGLDTVTAGIGFMMMHLAQRPDLQREIADDIDNAAPLIEEILRLELPAPMTPRVTTEDVEVCGVEIPAGAQVFIVLATANRENDRGGDPNEIDPTLGGRAHLTFGGGVHRCLGSHLARRELRVTLEEFHARIPEYEILEGFEPRIAWPSGTFHLESLPLTFKAT